MKKILSITFLILLLDQISKFYIKTHFYLNESVNVFPGIKLTFVENPGMAYGFQFGGLFGKYVLIFMRIFLIVFMIYLFTKWTKQKATNYLIIPMIFIFAGAFGNLLDGLFYGVIFDKGSVFIEPINQWNGYNGVSSFSLGHGYSGFMKGCVVDMLHFDLIDCNIPRDYPIIGGQRIQFFKYIFNIADASITIGGVLLFIFRKKAFGNGFKL